MVSRIVRRLPAAWRGNPGPAARQAALVDRCLVLLERRAERRLIETALTMRGEAQGDPGFGYMVARAQRQCPDVERARAVFLATDAGFGR